MKERNEILLKIMFTIKPLNLNKIKLLKKLLNREVGFLSKNSSKTSSLFKFHRLECEIERRVCEYRQKMLATTSTSTLRILTRVLRVAKKKLVYINN